MPAAGPGRIGSGDRGFALVAVVIAVAALSLMIAAVSDAARRHANEARGGIERLKLGAAIDGAITTVAVRLTGETLPPDLFTRPWRVDVGGVSITVSVRPEASKIDLNAAPPEVLADLFRATGMDGERAAMIAARIADWRDADGFAGARGAEASEYLSAGRTYTPTNRGFESVAELGLVLGASDALVRCLSADVTVFTNRSNVDATHASPHVRAALGLGDVPPAPNEHDGAGVQPGVIFELVAHAALADGKIISRRTILRVTGNRENPVWTLAAGAPAPDTAASNAACKAFAADARSDAS